MSVVTGKGGRYKYYKCNGRVRKCDSACPRKNFLLEKIDSLVLGTLKSTNYTAEHNRAIIDDLRESVAKKKASDDQIKLKHLEGELKDNEQSQAKLFEAVEKGFLDLDDQLRERAKLHKETRQTLLAEIAALKRQHNTPPQILTPQKVEALSKILIKRLTVPSAYARAYLGHAKRNTHYG